MAKEKEEKPAVENLPADWGQGEEVQSNWFKFEKVGDGVKGTLMKKYFQRSNDPDFPDQWIYELKVADGRMFNVAIPVTKPGTIQRLNACQLGLIVGVLFEKEGPEPKKKGFSRAKFLKVLSFGIDPEYNALDGGEEVTPPEEPEM